MAGGGGKGRGGLVHDITVVIFVSKLVEKGRFLEEVSLKLGSTVVRWLALVATQHEGRWVHSDPGLAVWILHVLPVLPLPPTVQRHGCPGCRISGERKWMNGWMDSQVDISSPLFGCQASSSHYL